MISEMTLRRAAGQLMLMPFFPTDPFAIAALPEALLGIALNDEHLEWLIGRVAQLYNAWPGVAEIKAVYCSKYKPLDGVDVLSAVYPDGIPSERGAPTPVMKQLPPGHVAATDDRAEAAFKIALAAQAQKTATFNAPATPAEIAAAPEWLRRLEGYE